LIDDLALQGIRHTYESIPIMSSKTSQRIQRWWCPISYLVGDCSDNLPANNVKENYDDPVKVGPWVASIPRVPTTSNISAVASRAPWTCRRLPWTPLLL